MEEMEGSSTMRCRGLRGATTATGNSAEAILAATRQLLEQMVARNALSLDDIASAFFTVTDDLDEAYPALAARELGWGEVALLCAREIPVPHSVRRCIRVLLHINTTRRQHDLHHVYLREAAALRPDLATAANPANPANPASATAATAPAVPVVERAAILGLGLMGASLGMALRKHGVARELVGFDAMPAVAERARERQAIDSVCASVSEAVTGSDLVVLATPPLAMRDLLTEIAPLVEDGAVITDLGSSKENIVTWAEALLPASGQFVGGHPMTGSEQSGVEAAHTALYDGCTWCLTPTPRTSDAALHRVQRIIEALGARPLLLSPERHDRAVALASHLPMLTASALVLTATQSADTSDALVLASGGFRDTTRVASGSPQMARDICLTNSGPLIAALDDYIRTLQSLRAQITARDTEIEGMFIAAREARNDWLMRQPRGEAAAR